MGSSLRDRTPRWTALAVGLGIAGFAAPAMATFNSGSTGADGPLDLTGTASGTTIEFDPNVFKNGSGQPLDPEGDNIYNFTTITIPAGVTLRMHAWTLRNSGPAYFLASGAVDIEGTIDLSGDPGHPNVVSLQSYGPARPGPGGFPGGLGTTTQGVIPAPTAGAGPGGAAPLLGSGCNVNDSQVGGNYARGQSPYGNSFLLPLVGGSGGAGWVGGGGGGGGAILLASNVSVTINGAILANGGATYNPASGRYDCYGGNCNGDCPGTGSGGAIRVLAPTFSGSGSLQATVSTNNAPYTFGWIRVETADNQWTGNAIGILTAVALSPSPIGLPGTSTGFPTLNITSIGGVSVPAAPTGTYNNPDVTLSSSQPLVIDLAGANIPAGTTANVQVFNQTLGLQTATATLNGTTGATTATVTVTLPPGVSLVYANATWTN